MVNFERLKSKESEIKAKNLDIKQLNQSLINEQQKTKEIENQMNEKTQEYTK